MNINILLDAGHGGLDENGNYVTAPDKMVSYEDFDIFEGVINRKICNKVIEKLPKDVNYNFITSGYEDTPIWKRNEIIKHIGKECNDQVIVISVHCNWWSDPDAKGIQAHCYGKNGYVSESGSKIGNLFIEKAEKLINNYNGYKLNVRKESPDSPVRPRNYAILRDHPYPSILTENGFMSNYDDAKFLMSEEGQEFIADIHVETVKAIQNDEIIL